MKIFRILQRHYLFLGIGPPSNQSNCNYSINKRALFGFLLFAYLISSQFVYIFGVANGFMEYMVCICSTSASFLMFVCFAAIVFRKSTLFECIDNMEKLMERRCKCPLSNFLEGVQQVERLSQIIFTLAMKISLQFQMLPNCIVSFAIYFFTDSESDSFDLPFPMWFPFDWTNPIGYSIAIILEYIVWGYENFVVSCTLSLGIGAFWFSILATTEIQCSLQLINDKAHSNGNQSNELKLLFAEFVYGHGIFKQAEHDFSDIFQPITMLLFTWSLLAISGALLIIQVEIVHHENVPLFLMIVCGIFALATVLINCELGQRMTNAFEEIYFSVNHFDWYLFPTEIKQILPMIIEIVQQPVELECFGSIACTRETFKNIIRCAFSYFMVLRQLGD